MKKTIAELGRKAGMWMVTKFLAVLDITLEGIYHLGFLQFVGLLGLYSVVCFMMYYLALTVFYLIGYELQDMPLVYDLVPFYCAVLVTIGTGIYNSRNL